MLLSLCRSRAWEPHGWHGAGTGWKVNRAVLARLVGVLLAELTERVKFNLRSVSLFGSDLVLRPEWRGPGRRRLTRNRPVLLCGPNPRRLKRLQATVPGLACVAFRLRHNRHLLGDPDRGRAEQDRAERACSHAGTGTEAR